MTDDVKQGDGTSETLAIPSGIRAEVDERDQGYCRFCGRYEGRGRALHHVRYGGDYVGLGGRRRHALDNLITVGWMFERDCHSIVHSNQRLWMPIAIEVIERPGVTMLQLYRWSRRRPLQTLRPTMSRVKRSPTE